ncbi:outer membrane protein assembly factor BamB family protein [Neobacillus sp. D3-1R]|uniref:outer membrane protein assembly factor BamB family protein n=1 Tax=Neobacillus sp. D3-1R TaxID=3445778 RepID=UPI003F9F776C
MNKLISVILLVVILLLNGTINPVHSQANQPVKKLEVIKKVGFNAKSICPANFECKATPLNDGTYMVKANHVRNLNLDFYGRFQKNKFLWKKKVLVDGRFNSIQPDLLDPQKKVIYENYEYALENENYIIKYTYDGNVLWKYSLPSRPDKLVMLKDGILFTVPKNTKWNAHGIITKIDFNGKKVWEYHLDYVTYGHPVYQDETIYQNVNGTGLIALTPNGEEKWRYSTDEIIFDVPVVSKNTVYFITGENLYALDLNGNLKWKKRIYDTPNSYLRLSLGLNDTPIVKTIRELKGVYPNGNFKALLMLKGYKEGKEIWKTVFQNAELLSSNEPIIDTNGIMYFLHRNGVKETSELYLLDTLNGKILYANTNPQILSLLPDTLRNGSIMAESSKIMKIKNDDGTTTPYEAPGPYINIIQYKLKK